ncbi:hypothetical protein JTE90_007111 [Oedothorax gibbosus]|uniref:Uncharacterized protein n=1 Tax=Oedothorax gibbosus TaxID=931172 RepID=A0AAV6VPS7_9ARAC|nr:hypothetical protein JTE90_007111 [Oedothorax gibbosus]
MLAVSVEYFQFVLSLVHFGNFNRLIQTAIKSNVGSTCFIRLTLPGIKLELQQILQDFNRLHQARLSSSTRRRTSSFTEAVPSH